MTVTNCDVALNSDDFYDVNGVPQLGTTLLNVSYNNVVSPTIQEKAYFNIDTSSIPSTDVISSATLYFYIHGYTAKKGITKTFLVWMLSADELSYNLIDVGTYSAAGWYSVVLTAAELLEIDKGEKTKFRVTIDDPGALKTRNMQIRAREYSPSDSFDAYMVITHAPPAKKKKTLLRLGHQKVTRFYKCRTQ